MIQKRAKRLKKTREEKRAMSEKKPKITQAIQTKGKEMKNEKQRALRVLAKAREDIQALRKRMDNRIGRKADGKDQDLKGTREFEPADLEIFVSLADTARQMEKDIEKQFKIHLKTQPIYNEYLSKVKGVGPAMAAWILAEFDIEIATTVSKMWQYAGMNPALVHGKKRIKTSAYKPEMGPIINKLTGFANEEEVIIQTTTAVRGDKLTPGFVSPFNKNIKTVLLGILAGSFIKCGSAYRKYYDDYKLRLENSDNVIVNPDVNKPRKDDGKKWSEVSKGHRDAAAKRYMIKMFLTDLYVNWRTLEGLPVRKPYAEEYLGKIHSE